ncbi:MAG: hypothetical protein PW843_24415 [Azospirillaceae bacterium]|nr:hypothetical protein [Azospirillaceae bacterium]
MSAGFHKDWIEGRRAFLLRFLVEAGGSCLQSMLVSAGLRAFKRDSEEDLLADIKHLVNMRCVETDDMDTLDGTHSIRSLVITPRGEAAAEGRGEPVPGVRQSRWDR